METFQLSLDGGELGGVRFVEPQHLTNSLKHFGAKVSPLTSVQLTRTPISSEELTGQDLCYYHSHLGPYWGRFSLFWEMIYCSQQICQPLSPVKAQTP